MPYADYTYYTDTYKGVDVEQTEFDRLAERASEDVDAVTNYTIHNYEFANLASFVQDQTKKAVCAQVEHYVMNGGYEAVESQTINSVNIGNFSYDLSAGAGEGNSGQIERYSKRMVDYLKPTGFLYSGVGAEDAWNYS